MKKIWTMAIIIGMLLMGINTVVTASLNPEIKTYNEKPVPKALYKASEQSSGLKYTPKARFVGIWGYIGDNETKGYVGGFIAKRGRIGVLKGVWNTTDNTSKGRVAGILKKGFFLGKVIINGSAQRIAGLYRVDKEKKIFQVKWMTKQKVGWAYCKIKL